MNNVDKFIKTKRKSIKIEITSLGEVIVYAPINASLERVQKFIQSKQKWIEKHKTTIQNNVNINNEILEYEKVLILGERINIIERNNKKSELKDGALYIKKEIDLIKKIKILEKFLKLYGSEIIGNRIHYFSNLMQLEPTSIKFSNAKKRWGSCDSLGNININWRIIMLPPVLIDYIIIHELSHLIEMNHSVDFWNIVASIMPNWKENRELLRKSNFILTLYRPN